MTTKVKSIIFSLVLIVFAMMMMPIAVDSVFNVQTDPQADAFPGCVVAAGATDVVLTEDLWQDDNDFVTAITATGAGAVPVAGVYTPASNTLNVTGLGADTPQDLTVTYATEVNEEYAGINAIVGLVPLLIVVGIIIVAIINGLWALKRED